MKSRCNCEKLKKKAVVDCQCVFLVSRPLLGFLREDGKR